MCYVIFIGVTLGVTCTECYKGGSQNWAKKGLHNISMAPNAVVDCYQNGLLETMTAQVQQGDQPLDLQQSIIQYNSVTLALETHEQVRNKQINLSAITLSGFP